MPLLVIGGDGQGHEGERIFDSTIILEYLEDRFPEPALLPKAADDPVGRARARMIEDLCDTQYEAINWGLGEVRSYQRAEGEVAAKLIRQAEHQIREVHAWLSAQLGEHEYFSFGGAKFGWADLCVIPMVNRSGTYGIWPEEGSALAKWFERVKVRPAVKKTLDECSLAISKVVPGGQAEAVRKGAMKREYRDHRLEWLVKSGGVDIVLNGLKDGNIRFSWPEAAQ